MKYIFLLLIFCLGYQVSIAQNFEQFNISQNLTDPRLVETVDLDGDALDEMLIASSEGLYLYHNQGNSQFVKSNLLDSVVGVYQFSLFDWGGDGDLDIFFTTFGAVQTIAWLENTGSLQFTYHLVTDTIAAPYYIEPFDLDNDNDDDILVSSSSTDELYWLKNDGLGSFSIDTIGNFVNQFQIADLNGDNDWDIIFGRPYTGITFSYVRAYQNDGSNNFSMITLKSGFSIIHEVLVEDINGDGFFDILVPDYHSDELVWLKNDGSYGFNTENVIKNNFDGPQGIALADVNGDGRKDIIAGSYNDDELYYFQGIGSVSSFSFSSGSLLYSGLNGISDLAIGNFDNQNNKDFVHTDLLEDELSVWTNNGSQMFTQDRLAFRFDSPRSFDMQDLDGDGDQDVAAVSNDGDQVAWMENVGDDHFETHILATNYEEPYTVRINDLDDDGDFDIVAASNNDDRITWWKNDGQGNFNMIQIATNLNAPRDFWIEDYDGDGDKDIAVICYWLYTKSGNTGAQWLKNDGSENFTLFEIDDNVRAGRSMRGADMNGDTLIDLVMSSYFYINSKLRIAVNTGSGFSITTVDDLLCEDFELVDFDGDQDMDILALDANLDSLYYYENLGNLQFSKQTLTHFTDLYGISPRDFDGDGDMDIIFTTGFSGFTNGGGFEWGIFRNNGNGVLTTEVWYQNLTMIKPLETFDYEMDGDYDVVLGFDFADKITMYKNLDVDCYLSVNLNASGPTTFCHGDSVMLSAGSSDSGISYQWYRNSAAISNATSAQFKADSSGTYQVAVTDSACTAFSAPQEVLVGKDYHENLSISFCENDSIVLDSLIITAPGTYLVTYQSLVGCDSTVTYFVSQNSTDSSYQAATICQGDTFNFYGQLLTQGGSYLNILSNTENCDSLLVLDLTVNPTYSENQTLTICSGDSAFLPGGFWAIQPGTYVDSLQTASGCDSIWSTQVMMNPVFSTNESFSICQGDSVFIHGAYENTSGTYVDTMSSSAGCDSIHAASLSVLPHVLNMINTSVCQGDSLFIAGAYRTQAGMYYDTLSAANTCDSILATNLILLPQIQETVSLTICQGDSIFLSNAWQTAAGTYVDTLIAANNCDSLLTSVLTVNQALNSINQLSICQGDSVFLAHAWRFNAGNYADSLTAANGCDSVHTSILTVNLTFNINTQLSVCQRDSAFLGGNWQTTAGSYEDVFIAANQCDSTVTTQLNINSVDTAVSRTGNVLTANAAGAIFQWLDCNANYNPIAGATVATFSPAVNGAYAVEITQNSCVDTSQCYVVNTIGLKEDYFLPDLIIYPNPSSGIVSVSGEWSIPVNIVSVTITDARGSIVLQKQVEVHNGEIDTQLNLSHLPNGAYQLMVKSADQSFTKSIVISK